MNTGFRKSCRGQDKAFTEVTSSQMNCLLPTPAIRSLRTQNAALQMLLRNTQRAPVRHSVICAAVFGEISKMSKEERIQDILWLNKYVTYVGI